MIQNDTTHSWLVVSTPLKNISQLEVGMTFPNIWKSKKCSKHFQTTNRIQIELIAWYDSTNWPSVAINHHLLCGSSSSVTLPEFSQESAAKVHNPPVQVLRYLHQWERPNISDWSEWGPQIWCLLFLGPSLAHMIPLIDFDRMIGKSDKNVSWVQQLYNNLRKRVAATESWLQLLFGTRAWRTFRDNYQLFLKWSHNNWIHLARGTTQSWAPTICGNFGKIVRAIYHSVSIQRHIPVGIGFRERFWLRLPKMCHWWVTSKRLPRDQQHHRCMGSKLHDANAHNSSRFTLDGIKGLHSRFPPKHHHHHHHHHHHPHYDRWSSRFPTLLGASCRDNVPTNLSASTGGALNRAFRVGIRATCGRASEAPRPKAKYPK